MLESRSTPDGAVRADAGYLYFRNFLEAHTKPMRRGVLQKRVERLYRALCEQVRPTIGLEIGAHEASFSAWLKETSPDTRCLAFEANPYAFAMHAERLIGAGVEYLNLAIGPTNGPVDLVIPTSVRHKERELTNRMASLKQHTESDSAQTVEVQSVRLDDFVTPGPDDRLVAWVDVEGATEIVFGSGSEVLGRTSLIYIEVERETKWDGQWLDVDVAHHLAGLGFVPIARDSQRPHQYNVIFASAELAADPAVAARVVKTYRPGQGGKRRRATPGDELGPPVS